jgi:hypothetical protein
MSAILNSLRCMLTRALEMTAARMPGARWGVPWNPVLVHWDSVSRRQPAPG